MERSELAADPALKKIVRRAKEAVKKQEWHRAIDLLDRAVRKHDDKALAGTLAQIYERIDNPALALSSYDLALKGSEIDGKNRKKIARRKAVLKQALQRDTFNAERYGAGYPRYGERIWIHANAIEKWIDHDDAKALSGIKGHVRSSSAFVTSKWVETPLDIMKHNKIEGLILRWRDGKPWEETGVFERLMGRIEIYGKRSGCTNMEDVKRRYRRIENQFLTVKREGRLRMRSELENATQFRETGGVLMHLGPGGEPHFGGSGFHRFAMARVLELWIPCAIGIVHESALKHLGRYRLRPY